MKNVAIICGGFSSEFDISVKSGTNIQENFPDGYKAYLVFIRKTGWSILLNGIEEQFDQSSMRFFNKETEISIDFSIIYTHGDSRRKWKVTSISRNDRCTIREFRAFSRLNYLLISGIAISF